VKFIFANQSKKIDWQHRHEESIAD